MFFTSNLPCRKFKNKLSEHFLTFQNLSVVLCRRICKTSLLLNAFPVILIFRSFMLVFRMKFAIPLTNLLTVPFILTSVIFVTFFILNNSRPVDNFIFGIIEVKNNCLIRKRTVLIFLRKILDSFRYLRLAFLKKLRRRGVKVFLKPSMVLIMAFTFSFILNIIQYAGSQNSLTL